MSEIVAYQATDPAAVTAVLDEWQAACAEWDDRVKSWCENYGGTPAIVKDDSFNEIRLVGIFVEGDETPENWRRFKTKTHLEPNRQRKAGKALDAELVNFRREHPGHLRKQIVRHFGVPEHLGLFGTFGFAPVPVDNPSDYFVIWRESHGWEGNEHFVRVPLSTYYRAKEEAEAGAA